MLRTLSVRATVIVSVILTALILALLPARAQTDVASGVQLAASNTLQPIEGDESYRLGPGDKLRVIVFGQNDLGGEYVVDGAGYVQLPLIGQVKAAGLTSHQFGDAMTAKLADGYLKDPRVSIEVTNFRPFYIIGEVNKPGEYPYVNGMSVLNAVALAGGYTNRADDSEVYVRRNGSGKEIELPADETTKVSPGDVIRVTQRFF